MTRRTLIRRIRARLDGERGFTILETVIAIMVVFASLTALAYTASIGFRYVGYGRDRIQATGVANRVMEDIRGLAYTKITNGIPSNELSSDSRIVSCSGTYRFETCSGEKIVSSTFASGYEAAWLVPHTDQLSVGNLDFTYHTYVTNDSPTTTPYRVTVIIEWANGAIRSAPNNSVRLQSLFWSPNGCVNPNTHPFAAPCQPFFYGQVDAPQARLDVTGQLHDFAVDFDSLALTLPGLSATAQEEQTTQLNAATTLSGIEFVDSTGTTDVGSQQASSEADDEVETSAASASGGNATNLSALSASRLNADCCNQIGLIASVPAGDQEHRATTVDAKVADTYACPTTGTRETDLLPCAGGHIRQVGTITVAVPVTHVTPLVGSANLLRIVGPATDTTAKIDRDASARHGRGRTDRCPGDPDARDGAARWVPRVGHDGADRDVDEPVARHELLRPAGRVLGHGCTRSQESGRPPTPRRRSRPGPSSTTTAPGTRTRSVTDATLDTLTVTCSKTQLVGLSTVTWRVTVAAGGIRHASTTTTQTADPADAQTRWDAEATVQPIEITIRYEYIVDGVQRDQPRSRRSTRGTCSPTASTSRRRRPNREMAMMRRPTIRRLRSEDGMTLVELMVAMAILSIVSLVFTTTLSSVQRAVVEEDVRIRLNDQVRLAVQSIDRLVRSGNILYDPVDESGNDPFDATATGYMFRIYTQAEQTRGPGRPVRAVARGRRGAPPVSHVARSSRPRTLRTGRSWPRASSTGRSTSPPSRSTPPAARSPSSST